MKLGIQKKVVISIVIVGMLPLLVGLYLTYIGFAPIRSTLIIKNGWFDGNRLL